MNVDEIENVLDGVVPLDKPKEERKQYDPKPKGQFDDTWLDKIVPEDVDRSKFKTFERNFSIDIGADEPTDEVKAAIATIVEKANSKGFTLRSGGDYRSHQWLKDLESKSDELVYFLPWEKMETIDWEEFKAANKLFTPRKDQYGVAAKYHTAWDRIPPVVKKFLASHTLRLLGVNFDRPINFYVFHSADGAETTKKIDFKKIGNAHFSLRIAEQFDIPTFNIYRPEAVQRLLEYMDTNFK